MSENGPAMQAFFQAGRRQETVVRRKRLPCPMFKPSCKCRRDNPGLVGHGTLMPGHKICEHPSRLIRNITDIRVIRITSGLYLDILCSV